MDTKINHVNAALVTGLTSNTLNRAAVYASLADIDHDDHHDSQKASSSKKKITPQSHDNPKMSAMLLSFYSDVSTTLHRTAPRLDGKNTSARPLSLNDISSRLSQRAITFTSNYYKNSNSNTENAASKMKKKKEKKRSPDHVTIVSSSYNVSTAQMKRKRQNLMQRISLSKNHDNEVESLQLDICNQKFLQRLNREWNSYVKNLLQVDDHSNLNDTTYDDTNSITNVSIGKIHERVRSLQNTNSIEWVGAYVRICHDIPGKNIELNQGSCHDHYYYDFEQENPQHPKKQRKVKGQFNSPAATRNIEGILISHSPNDWMIVPVVANIDETPIKINCSNRDDNDNDETQKEQGTAAISLLPKVKIPKTERCNDGTTSIVVTACIPFGNSKEYSFMDFYNKDGTQFLTIHLQCR